MHEDKYGARLDQMQEMINNLRKDLEGFKKEQIERFEASLSALEKIIARFRIRQDSLSIKFWVSATVNLIFIFVSVIYFVFGR